MHCKICNKTGGGVYTGSESEGHLCSECYQEKNQERVIAYLKITTWKESTVTMAEHYYGDLIMGLEYITVTYILDQGAVKRLNRTEEFRMVPSLGRHIVGDDSSQFFTEEGLKKKAIEKFKEDQKGFKYLLCGDNSIAEPQEMLVGPEPLMGKANQLWAEFEAFNGWDCKEEEETAVQKLSDSWEELLK